VCSIPVGNSNLRFEGIPIFPAEHFAKVTPVDTMKRKQFIKGINQLSEEGTILGVVGILQLEVLGRGFKNSETSSQACPLDCVQ